VPGLEGGGKVIVSPKDFQTISTTKEDHHDTIHSGNHDVGGDATDNFIDQVSDTDFERAQRPIGEMSRIKQLAGLKEDDEPAPAPVPVPSPTPDTLNDPHVLNLDDIDAKTLDSAEGFKAVLTKAATEAGVEGDLAQSAGKLVAAAPDGSVDVNKTLTNTLAAWGEAMPAMVKMIEDLIDAYKNAMNSPEFASLPPDVKQSVKEAFNELRAQLPVIQRQAQDMQKQVQAMQGQPAPVQENVELARWLKIAGLK
jgi:hypothetical protein